MLRKVFDLNIDSCARIYKDIIPVWFLKQRCKILHFVSTSQYLIIRYPEYADWFWLPFSKFHFGVAQ